MSGASGSLSLQSARPRRSMRRPRSVSISPTRSSSVSPSGVVVAVSAGRGADDGLTRGAPVRPLRRRPRRRRHRALGGLGHEEAGRVERAADRGVVEGEGDQGDRRVVDAEECGRDLGDGVGEQARPRREPDMPEHHRVGVDSTWIGADAPVVTCTAPRSSISTDSTGASSSTVAAVSATASAAASASISPPIPPRRVKKTGAVGSGGCARRSARSPSSSDRDRSRDPRHLRRHRQRAQPVGVAGVDPPDQRIDEPLEHLPPESGRDERTEGVWRRRPPRQQRFERRPRHPAHAEDPRSRDGQDLARNAQREARRQPAQSPAPTHRHPRSTATTS